MSTKIIPSMEARPNRSLYQSYMHQPNRCKSGASSLICTQNNTRSTRTLFRMLSRYPHPRTTCQAVIRSRAITLSHLQDTVTVGLLASLSLNSLSLRMVLDNKGKTNSSIKQCSLICRTSSAQHLTRL